MIGRVWAVVPTTPHQEKVIELTQSCVDVNLVHPSGVGCFRPDWKNPGSYRVVTIGKEMIPAVRYAIDHPGSDCPVFPTFDELFSGNDPALVDMVSAAHAAGPPYVIPGAEDLMWSASWKLQPPFSVTLFSVSRDCGEDVNAPEDEDLLHFPNFSFRPHVYETLYSYVDDEDAQ